VLDFIVWLVLLVITCAMFVLVIFADGLLQTLGFYLMALQIGALMILDRKRPDWRDSWRRKH
jgi:hypothetical protein